MASERLQVALGFEGGLATTTGSDDGLAIDGIGAVASSEDAWQGFSRIGGRGYARRSVDGADVACLVDSHEWAEHIGVGLVANGEEEAVDGQVVAFLIGLAFAAHHMGSLHTAFAIEANGVVFEEHFYLLVLEDALLHHIAGAQIGFANDEVYLLAELGKIDGFLAGCVATAHNSHCLLAIEEAVAGGTGRHTHAIVLLLVVEAVGSQRSVNTVSARLQALTYCRRCRIASRRGDVQADRMSVSRAMYNVVFRM